MPHGGAARNFESTVRGLAERGNEVHLAFDRGTKSNLPGLMNLVNALVEQYPGVTAEVHPPLPKTDSAIASSRLRVWLDYLRFSGPAYERAPKLRTRGEGWLSPREKRLLSSSGPKRALLRSMFRSAVRSIPPDETALAFVREQAPDAVLVTPLLEPGSAQHEFLRAANLLGIPTCFCVHSWDNLTNKGLVHEIPTAVTVWNEMQVEEAVSHHRVSADRVVVTGATAYDHWFQWKPSRDRAEFAAAAGLDPDRPFVLYLGSSGFIAPNEADFIAEWMAELRMRGLDDLQVLARPHPTNPLLGEKKSSDLEIANLTLYPPAGANPTDEESRNDYFDSLYYCSAATGVNTSAFLEAAILGRPVLTVLSPRYEETQMGMVHFHLLLEAGGGLLHLAETFDEHADQLHEALAVDQPERQVDARSRAFTKAFIRPFGLDEPATPRMLKTVEELAAGERGAGSAGRATVTGSVLAWGARRAVRRARRRARPSKKAFPGVPARTKRPKAAKAGEKKPSPQKAERIAAAAELRAAKEAHHEAKLRAKDAKEAREEERMENRKAKLDEKDRKPPRPADLGGSREGSAGTPDGPQQSSETSQTTG
jgi:hypothetical protein